MQRLHIHKPSWVHVHRTDWHAVGSHLDHMVHDPRFWAALALAVLLGLMILTTIFSDIESSSNLPPIYPFVP